MSIEHGFGKGMGGHHRPSNRDRDTWLTPPDIINALGEFDLDPACPVGMPWPTAKTMYTIEDNGLMQPWEGRVWLNPPYGREAAHWLELLARHGNGIALIFARTETDMFHRHVWPHAHGVFFFRKRLDFLTIDGTPNIHKGRNANAGAPSCLVAYGMCNLLAIVRSMDDGAINGTLVDDWYGRFSRKPRLGMAS